jgi:antitoxin (DNA-binding transcriptional repressor) of toxin-antitoxin stability system
MTRIDMAAVQQDLHFCLRRVASGESFVIVQDGRPVAELRPAHIHKPRPPRPLFEAPVLLDDDDGLPDEYGAAD